MSEPRRCRAHWIERDWKGQCKFAEGHQGDHQSELRHEPGRSVCETWPEEFSIYPPPARDARVLALLKRLHAAGRDEDGYFCPECGGRASSSLLLIRLGYIDPARGYVPPDWGDERWRFQCRPDCELAALIRELS
jgi:hypothetical protein